MKKPLSKALQQPLPASNGDYFNKLIRPAVVIVDMQEAFLDQVDNKVRVRLVDEHLRVLAICRDVDIPAIALEYDKKGATIEPIRSALSRVRRHRILEKSTFSGFSCTELRSTLRQRYKAETVFLMGVFAIDCVLDTAIGGAERDFVIRTAESVIADRCTSEGLRHDTIQIYRHQGFFL